MIISHSHKFIFIKPWKTAGTSVETALSQYCSGNDIVTPLGDYWFNRDEKGKLIHHAMNAEGFEQHDDALTIKSRVPPEVWDNYFKFSMTRNPWDRALSLFFWRKRQDPKLTPKKRIYNYLGVPFDELREIKKIFTQYLQTDWPNNDRFYIIDGKLCVDFVIRYERLAQDFGKVCKIIGVPIAELPHLKSGIRRDQSHYSQYYDARSQAIVYERHKNDIELFNYKFE